MPKRPPREFWEKAYPKVRRKVKREYGTDGKRAGRITGALWYKKMKRKTKAKYEELRIKRERRLR
jgi:hypothetical protein